jgi:hypothetical protein
MAATDLFYRNRSYPCLAGAIHTGIKVWAIGRKIEQPASGTFDCVTHALRLVCWQIVHDDDIARCQGWNENLFTKAVIALFYVKVVDLRMEGGGADNWELRL